MKAFNIKRRGLIRLICFGAAAFIILGVLAYINHQKAVTYKRYLQNSYQHSLTELVSSIDQINSGLQKCLYVSSPPLVVAICTDIYGNAKTAELALSELPFSDVQLENTSKFISLVGDYTYTLSKGVASGSGLFSEEEYGNLQALSDNASVLSQNLIQLQADMQDENLSLDSFWGAQQDLSKTDGTAVSLNVNSSFESIEQEFPEIPSLIYDGPFSESIDKKEALMLSGKQAVSQEEALEIAANFLDLKPGIFEYAGNCMGKIETYRFSAAVDGGQLSIEITKLGGMVYSIMNSRQVSSAQMSAEEAVTAAKDFLDNRGITNMRETYWTLSNNIVIVNFAYEQDGVICYPDLIKVSIALDSGRVVGYESLGYLMSHTPRTIPEARITADEAREHVPSTLTVLAHEMTIIPSDGENEIYCHEFKCETGNGQHYLLYVNAQTGVEEKILILLEDANGTLVT